MKKDHIIFWIATIFIFLLEGMMPVSAYILAPENVTEGVIHLGYPTYFAYTLVIFKVLGVWALVLPKIPHRLKEWAYAGFAFDFIFAAISHFVVDGAGFVSFFPFIILAILGVSYVYYYKVYRNGESIF